jgi:hypothetical protein
VRAFWTPIAIRALAIFAIGLAIVTGVRQVAAHARTHAEEHAGDAVQHAVQAALDASTAAAGAAAAEAEAATASRRAEDAALAADRLHRVPGLRALAALAGSAAAKAIDQPFVLDGRRVGSMARVRIHRAATDAPLDVRLTVATAPGAAVSPCAITPVESAKVDLKAGFRCTDGAGLDRIGTVRFEPAGEERGIHVARAQAREMATGEPVDVDLQLAGPVRLDVRGDGGERVRLHAGDGGATIVVKDADGQTVRLVAGERGVSMTVDSAK